MKKNIFTIITIAILLIIAHISCDKNVRVIHVFFTKTSLTLDVGTTSILSAVVIPTDATNKTLTWESNNLNVATVDQNGKVTAIAEGSATITVSTVDGNYKARCNIKVINLQEIEMIFVEGGTFMMGCTGEECLSEEVPARQVTLSSYHISKYPVTQKLWKDVMGHNPSHFKGDNLPVEQVGWNDTQDFINKLNQLTGKNYSLPTEAQWEFAARGGNKSEGYVYSGSNDVNLVAWFGNNSNQRTQPVGTKAPNELGIYDMSGNVYEWVNDWFENYKDLSQIDPQGPDYGSSKVARGGGYFSVFWACRATFRVAGAPHQTRDYPGFRLALPE
ncbi:MAG: SUMF1/EgtB/PvdO family nonheme iron enzyme [Lentimicrobiaceae bacterium]|nr:SUMF1/EgtB/PvdO family nonheme iron enzyme [Lentimicrobiaceae bacterium]